MEEFALCWNKLKFAENLSTGFQSLYDRGDFVDCTIAVDGQLLQCHKLVLAICSPYFREIFMNNPCRHPISKYIYSVVLSHKKIINDQFLRYSCFISKKVSKKSFKCSRNKFIITITVNYLVVVIK